MWEQVAVRFNANRARGTLERDVESLRRKFKNLYAKPKPSGHGEVPARLRPIVMAKAAQLKIEAEGGAHTSHDGLDDGEDDEELDRDVLEASEDQGPTLMDVNVNPRAYHRRTEDKQTPSTPSHESTVQSESSNDVLPERNRVDEESGHQHSMISSKPTQADQDNTLASAPPRSLASTTPKKRTPGRPRRARREPVPTVATPDGPPLHRDPARVTADTEEANAHRRLSVSSDRLGGEDLRIVRDNIDLFTRRQTNDNGKRPVPDTTRQESSSYSKTRRSRAKQRMEEIQRDVDDIGDKLSSSGDDIMRMLLLFQKDSDRRAEAEERRRRDEREERAEAERIERAEREILRRQETEEAERRRQQDIVLAREERDELRRSEALRELNLAQEREESRRRFEERLELERIESCQRHEQMMLVLSNMQKK
ncbi:hypothetical protein PHMEG_0002011 [Phytophthora megakarya]|uniref:DUF6818 domain-containing protein n=1 Tax=Phytophthora megakarya TaxID=4795 RepID=A0A225X0C0_9STRA|nr:hypothetical protein PHMEG_0002011 [Phytophthora megakarya]